jgi:Spy/CpxP family protein refolding chaperone
MRLRAAVAVFAASMTGIGDAAMAATPYASLQQRLITSLSQDQIADLRAGRGMGLALPAELNGYPGPRHVLEWADELALTPEQRARTEMLFREMQEQAVALGEQVILSEAALDRLFVEGHPSEGEVLDAALAAARLQGSLRAHHLRYHLAMRELLSPEQIERYGVLRGYAVPEKADGRHGQGGHGHGGHGHGGHGP